MPLPRPSHSLPGHLSGVLGDVHSLAVLAPVHASLTWGWKTMSLVPKVVLSPHMLLPLRAPSNALFNCLLSPSTTGLPRTRPPGFPIIALTSQCCLCGVGSGLLWAVSPYNIRTSPEQVLSECGWTNQGAAPALTDTPTPQLPLTSRAEVNAAAGPEPHWSKATHSEVGHILRLAEGQEVNQQAARG